MKNDPIRKYVDKATPNPERGRLGFHYTLDDQAILNEKKKSTTTKHNSMRALSLIGGKSPLALLERAVAGEIVGKGSSLIKESFYNGFISEIESLSAGHPLR